MSTPLAHNALLVKAIVAMLESLQAIGTIGKEIDINKLALEMAREIVAFYNYPDAVQAVRRPDGTILGRRVTHFELPKEFGVEPNWHELFTPQFIKSVTEKDAVAWSCFHDTADQDGDIMGQYTDFYAWEQARKKFMNWAESTGNDKAMLLAIMVGAHLKVADWFNDQEFRLYVSMQKDGSIKIGRATFGPDEKGEAFGLFKRLLMSLQEDIACKELKSNFESASELNDAIEASYRENLSPWLANNSLRFVKPISFDGEFSPSEEQLQLLEKAEISYEDLVEDTSRFVHAAQTETGDYILDALDYIQSFLKAFRR